MPYGTATTGSDLLDLYVGNVGNVDT
jgi:hypothetical protein